MKERYNILFFHPSGLYYGGTERLLQIFAKYMVRCHNVFFAYSPEESENRKEYFAGTGVVLVPFTYAKRQSVEPYTLQGAQPDIFEIIKVHNIQVICTPVSAHYQFPLSAVPASMPFIITSPFGHYATNGNVRKVYVSGSKNLARIQKRGIREAELIYDPLEDFPSEVVQRAPVGRTIVFGRLGRPDNAIFDPISIRAFARLEQKYGDRVKYIVLSPPPNMVHMAQEFGLRNFVIVDESQPDYWKRFYMSVDILAHARLDGETFGKAIAEAMLAGLPIITHRSRYHNEHLNFIDQSFACWSEPDDVDAYYAHMEWFVEHPDYIRSMGAKARQKALQLFSVDRIMPPILSEFEKAAQTCTYYTPRGWIWGYIGLWAAWSKIFPYYILKLIAYHVPWFRTWATKVYNKRPLF